MASNPFAALGGAASDDEDVTAEKKSVAARQLQNKRRGGAKANAPPAARLVGAGTGGARAPKRVFDRHSGTGRGKEGKKHGAGGHNWGVPGEEANANDATGNLDDDVAGGGAGAGQEDAGANALTLAEYKAQHAKERRGEAFQEVELRKASEKIEDGVAYEKKDASALEEEAFIKMPQGEGKGKKPRAKKEPKKKVMLDTGFKVRDPNADEPEFHGGSRGGRGRGGFRGGRGGRGGGFRGGSRGGGRGPFPERNAGAAQPGDADAPVAAAGEEGEQAQAVDAAPAQDSAAAPVPAAPEASTEAEGAAHEEEEEEEAPFQPVSQRQQQQQSGSGRGAPRGRGAGGGTYRGNAPRTGYRGGRGGGSGEGVRGRGGPPRGGRGGRGGQRGGGSGGGSGGGAAGSYGRGRGGYGSGALNTADQSAFPTLGGK